MATTTTFLTKQPYSGTTITPSLSLVANKPASVELDFFNYSGPGIGIFVELDTSIDGGATWQSEVSMKTTTTFIADDPTNGCAFVYSFTPPVKTQARLTVTVDSGTVTIDATITH